MFKTASRLCLPFALLSLIVGCDGGGGDGGGVRNIGGSTPPPVGQLVTITENNAPTVAGAAAEQVLEDTLIGTLTTTGIPVVRSGSSAAIDLLRLSGSSLAPGMAAATLPTQDCAASGTVDITFEVDSPETISRGDEFGFEFDACNDGAGAVISGGLSMTVLGINGDPNSELIFLQLRVQMSAFSVTQDGVTSGAEGAITIAIDSRQPPVTTITVSSDAFTVTSGGETETVFNLAVTVVENDGVFPTAVSVDTSFRLSAPRIGGDILVATSVSLTSFGEEYPFGGEFTVTGAANGKVTVIALDGDSVRLEVDVNGDGATDVTIDTTWAAIMGEPEPV